MLWDDPWIDAATRPPTEGTGVSPFCTTLPPPLCVLDPGLRFGCEPAAILSDTDLTEWRELVGTRWGLPALRQRLADAWIARLWVTEEATNILVATCVLRRGSAPSMWILETLVAQPKGKGYATALTRSAMTWIWKTNTGPFVLAYTWELTVAQLAVAWWRGWLKSAAAFEYGWIWTGADDCQFCGRAGNRRQGPGPAMPLLFRSAREEAIVSDSGLGDGLGYVLSFRGEIDWSAVAQRGKWQALWWHGVSAPAGASNRSTGASSRAIAGSGAWQWTGEVIVVGLLNYDGRGHIPTRWITAEVAPASL